MKFFYENKDQNVYASYGTCLAFGAHLHNHIELIYMMEGQTKAIIDSKEYIVCAGDVFIAFPNQIHQYQNIDLEKYFLTIFPPELLPEFQELFQHKIPVSPVIRNVSGNKTMMNAIECIIDEKKLASPISDTIIKGHYLVLLGELIKRMSFEETKNNDSNTIKAILNYCTENYTKNLQLQTVSHSLHISKYYLSHLFSEKLHMGFCDYIGMLRVNEACRLLSTQDKSITEVAFLAGFNSMRSFNRLFQKLIGCTPRQYRNKIHAESCSESAG